MITVRIYNEIHQNRIKGDDAPGPALELSHPIFNITPQSTSSPLIHPKDAASTSSGRSSLCAFSPFSFSGKSPWRWPSILRWRSRPLHRPWSWISQAGRAESWWQHPRFGHCDAGDVSLQIHTRDSYSQLIFDRGTMTTEHTYGIHNLPLVI